MSLWTPPLNKVLSTVYFFLWFYTKAVQILHFIVQLFWTYVCILLCILFLWIPICLTNLFHTQIVKGIRHLNPLQLENLDPVCDFSTPQPSFVCFLYLSSAGVIERWELLQAQAVRQEQCYSRDRKQLTSDLHDITSWLSQVIPELTKVQNAETACVSVQIMEARVKQLKVRAY